MRITKVLILYGTVEGQTAKVSGFTAEVARDRGHEAEVMDIKGFPSSFAPESIS